LSDAERAPERCFAALPVSRWCSGRDTRAVTSSATDSIAEEVAVALSYNGISHVVMMMTPANLADFAIGFSLSEGIIEVPGDILAIETCERSGGIELALTVGARHFSALQQWRRNLTGRTGCGICGAESLEQAMRPVARVARTLCVPAVAIESAGSRVAERQPLQRRTGAVHAAAWCALDGEVVLVREDVGRHNALDKLIGALVAADSQRPGFAVVSSRASYEMVTKSARAGIEVLVAVSAPTTLAVRLATAADLTLIGFARAGRFSIYVVPERVRL